MSDMSRLEVFGKECRVLVMSVVARASWGEERTTSDNRERTSEWLVL
jgi:hypothetical protein